MVHISPDLTVIIGGNKGPADNTSATAEISVYSWTEGRFLQADVDGPAGIRGAGIAGLELKTARYIVYMYKILWLLRYLDLRA